MEQNLPERRRIVVDGSNIATEGRTLPSLAQLDEAIRAFLEEYRGFTTSDVTVVVDASFGHRIDPSEVPAFEQAVEHGEMVAPPAGAVGRGDGFILRIAEKSGALVLSNDSFQEFHAERPGAGGQEPVGDLQVAAGRPGRRCRLRHGQRGGP